MQPYIDSSSIKLMHEQMIDRELNLARADAGPSPRHRFGGVRSLAGRILTAVGTWISPELRSPDEAVVEMRSYRPAGSDRNGLASEQDSRKAA